MSDEIGKLLPSESALLIGQKAASKFKVSETITVKALERLQAMRQRRRVGAEAEGLKPDQLEKLYQA